MLAALQTITLARIALKMDDFDYNAYYEDLNNEMLCYTCAAVGYHERDCERRAPWVTIKKRYPRNDCDNWKKYVALLLKTGDKR